MTEHSSVIFVFFFLAEYGSLVIMSIIIADLFLGGYTINFSLLASFVDLFYIAICCALNTICFMLDLINYLGDRIENIYIDLVTPDVDYRYCTDTYLFNIGDALLSFNSHDLVADFVGKTLNKTIIMTIKTLLVVFVFI